RVDHVLDHHVLVRGDGGHAVVGHHNQVQLVGQAERVDAVQQPADRGVDLADGGVRLVRGRPVAMCGAVDRLEIQGAETRAGGLGFTQPSEHRVDPVSHRHFRVKGFPVTGLDAVNGGLRAGPEHGACAQAGLFRGDPDRLGVPPATVRYRVAIAQAELAQLRVLHRVVDDAVVVRTLAGDDGEVVGEG